MYYFPFINPNFFSCAHVLPLAVYLCFFSCKEGALEGQIIIIIIMINLFYKSVIPQKKFSKRYNMY